MPNEPPDAHDLSVVAPSLGGKYSGINASMIAVLPELERHIGIAALGFHIPEGIRRIGFLRFCLTRRPGRWVIWHARRNIDMLVGLFLRRVLRFPLILVFTSAAQRTHTWITRFYYRRMDAVIATTAAAASYLDRECVVISHGVNTDIFCPPADRPAAWAARGLPGHFGIGILGRVRPQKGTEEFVEAMIRVLPVRSDWTAVIVGQTTRGYERFERRLRARLRNAGLADRVCFAGYLRDPAELPDWYKALSVVVCASRNEGFGLTCLEAMACGCPVVATRTGAWPELISEDSDGYLVPCNDVPALADAVLRITGDPGRTALMGRSARDKVLEKYRIQYEADAIWSVYRRLLDQKAIPA